MRRAGATALFAVAIAMCLPSAGGAEVVQKRGVRVSIGGKIVPKRLPRHGEAPVSVSVSGQIAATAAADPPQLRTLTIAINRNGRVAYDDLPRCRVRQIAPSTPAQALATCGRALVGTGHFSADVRLPEQSPFPSEGRILAFNGRLGGRPAMLAHIYGTAPVPTSYVLPFRIESGTNAYGTVLQASLPDVTGDWGFVTGISLVLDRPGYVSAGCPAPAGFGGAVFPLLRASFGFEGGLRLDSTLQRTCRARAG